MDSLGIKHLKKGTDMNKLFAIMKDESGATAIEYGLIAALVSIVCIATLTSVGTQLSTTFSKVSSSLGGAR